jgi:predicted amidohydrolase YtcJ
VIGGKRRELIDKLRRVARDPGAMPAERAAAKAKADELEAAELERQRRLASEGLTELNEANRWRLRELEHQLRDTHLLSELGAERQAPVDWLRALPGAYQPSEAAAEAKAKARSGGFLLLLLLLLVLLVLLLGAFALVVFFV